MQGRRCDGALQGGVSQHRYAYHKSRGLGFMFNVSILENIPLCTVLTV